MCIFDFNFRKKAPENILVENQLYNYNKNALEHGNLALGNTN